MNHESVWLPREPATIQSLLWTRQSDIVEVLEVDAQGRVAVARTCDAATNSYGVVEFNQGYRAQPGAVKDYNPISALRLKGDEVDG